VTGGCAAALEEKAIAAIVNVGRVIAPVHITLSLLCGVNESAIRACGEFVSTRWRVFSKLDVVKRI
jgi:hypothetical protein